MVFANYDVTVQISGARPSLSKIKKSFTVRGESPSVILPDAHLLIFTFWRRYCRRVDFLPNIDGLSGIARVRLKYYSSQIVTDILRGTMNLPLVNNRPIVLEASKPLALPRIPDALPRSPLFTPLPSPLLLPPQPEEINDIIASLDALLSFASASCTSAAPLALDGAPTSASTPTRTYSPTVSATSSRPASPCLRLCLNVDDDKMYPPASPSPIRPKPSLLVADLYSQPPEEWNTSRALLRSVPSSPAPILHSRSDTKEDAMPAKLVHTHTSMDLEVVFASWDESMSGGWREYLDGLPLPPGSASLDLSADGFVLFNKASASVTPKSSPAGPSHSPDLFITSSSYAGYTDDFCLAASPLPTAASVLASASTPRIFTQSTLQGDTHLGSPSTLRASFLSYS